MKLVKYKTERKGQYVTLLGSFRDHMRRPVNVKIQIDQAEDYEPQPVVTFKDQGHLGSLMEIFAEIAWAWGWRPKGLVNTVAQVVQNYKQPE